MRTFELKIELENDAMRDGAAIAEALRSIANVIEPRTEAGLPGCTSKIWDKNAQPRLEPGQCANRKER
jgi:hypothetical protein